MTVVMMKRKEESGSDDRLDDLCQQAELEANRQLLKLMGVGICMTNAIGFTSVIILILAKF